jgi:phosphoribosylformimino-5-aminoimidazole carboxamide ribotide isomerase
MIEIIPAIDIIDGKCVRLSQGNFNKVQVYSENPVDIAKQFEQHGIKRLHLVDLDGAKSNHVVNYKTLEFISKSTKLKIDFGGGIKSEDDINTVFSCGANQITIGSIAVKNKKLAKSWIHKYGVEKIILGADVAGNKIAVNGWVENTDESIQKLISEYLVEKIKYVICTDISKDGMLQGPSTTLYKNILNEFSGIKLIASGGISSISDIETLDAMDLYGVIIGKAIYEKKIRLKDLLRFSETKI